MNREIRIILLEGTLLAQFCLAFQGCGVLLVGAGLGTAVVLSQTSVSEAALKNKEKLNRLTYGISKKFALEIMGTKPFRFIIDHKDKVVPNPYKTSKGKMNGKPIDVIYYVTRIEKDDDVYTNSELTPLVFENDRLIGWGWQALK